MRIPGSVSYTVNRGDQIGLDVNFSSTTSNICISELSANGAIINLTPDQAIDLIDALKAGLLAVFPDAGPQPPAKGEILYAVNFLPQPEGQKPAPVSNSSFDPHKGYLIRHESRDTFFTEQTLTTRSCAGVRADATIFFTELEYIRACQGMRHGWEAVSISILYTVGYQLSPQDRIFWYVHDGMPTTARHLATRLTHQDAQRIAETFIEKTLIAPIEA